MTFLTPWRRKFLFPAIILSIVFVLLTFGFLMRTPKPVRIVITVQPSTLQHNVQSNLAYQYLLLAGGRKSFLDGSRAEIENHPKLPVRDKEWLLHEMDRNADTFIDQLADAIGPDLTVEEWHDLIDDLDGDRTLPAPRELALFSKIDSLYSTWIEKGETVGRRIGHSIHHETGQQARI